MNEKAKKPLLGGMRQYTMLGALVIIAVFFQYMTGLKAVQIPDGTGFFQAVYDRIAGGILLKPMNIANLIFQNAYVVILATGMLICILTGGNIDLSVGSVVALVGACAGTFIVSLGWNVYASAALCILIGLLIGAWQGFWIAYVRIPAFIVTLSGMLVFRGLALIILNGMTIAPFPHEFLMYSTGFIPDLAGLGKLFGTENTLSVLVGFAVVIGLCVSQLRGYLARKRKGYQTESALILILKIVVMSAAIIALFMALANYKGIPTVLVILGILLVVYGYITQNTVIGRHIYALGGNEKAARLSGVKTNRLLFLAYVNMAVLAAIAGLVFAARLNSASPQAGQSFELDAIGACYIGGASAYGGIGTVGGTLIGALIMGVLNNGMSILGVNSNVQQVVKGLVLLVAVAVDVVGKQNLLQSIPLPAFLKKKTTT